MFAILAEDDSDADSVANILKRHCNNDRLSVKKKGYDGCGELCRKGSRDIKSWSSQGINKFVICHDADSNPEGDIRQKVLDKIVQPSGVAKHCCIIVPVQEIEAWLIADEQAIAAVIPSFQMKAHNQPESIQDPKEWLVKKSEAANGKPLYSPKTFNAAVSKHIRFEVVQKKCPSFKAFIDSLNEKGW